MSDRLKLGTVTLCRTCRKAIGQLEDLEHMGWWHFSDHDGHTPMPAKWLREDW